MRCRAGVCDRSGHPTPTGPCCCCQAACVRPASTTTCSAQAAAATPTTRFIAATPPGFGGRPAPDDLTVEHYASLAGDLAAELDADLVVGHSLGANHALEMVAAGYFYGTGRPALPDVLSRRTKKPTSDGSPACLAIPIVGRVPWMVFPHIIDSSFRGRLPADRHDELVAEMKRTDMQLCRRMVVAYFEYLDRRAPLSRPAVRRGHADLGGIRSNATRSA